MATCTRETVTPLVGPYNLGEGPHWDDNIQKLYFVDIFAQKVHRLDPETNTTTSVYIENGPVGVVVPVSGSSDKLVAGSGTDFILVPWDGKKDLNKCPTKKLATVDTDRVETRWNDGKVDSSGRFWGGTMGLEKDGVFPPEKGTFYSIASDLVPKKEISPVTISNGLTWSIKDDTFYYIDSPICQIWAYDYNPKSGAISNKKVVFDTKKNNIPGFPDGMTIDTDGNLWVAVYSGACILKINPKTGKLEQRIKMPTDNITSVTFGGPNFDVLYVTTATQGLTEADLKKQPHAGYVFAVTGLGVRGCRANTFKLNT